MGVPRERLVNAYLEAWTDLAPLPELRRLADAADRVSGAQRFETFRRQLDGVDPEAFRDWGEAVLQRLAQTTR